MIVGSGLIARAFAPLYAYDTKTVVFASGVSNSAETDLAAFARERELIQRQLDFHPTRLLYFGSCNTSNPQQQSAYFNHKRAMEALVQESDGGVVIRLPQVVGSTPNRNTLTNHLYQQIMTGAPVTVWKRAERNLIDIEDVVTIAHHLLTTSTALPSSLAIASPWTLSMGEIVRLFEDVLNRRATVLEVDRGDTMCVDYSLAERAARELGLDFGPTYPRNLIKKYYGNRMHAP